MNRIVAGLLAGSPQVVVDGLPRVLGQLELHGVAGLLLSNGCPIDGIASRGDVLDLDAHHIAAAQLAVDGEVEERQVSLAPFDLKFGSD